MALAREGFGDTLAPGDLVALHWDRICGRLTKEQARRLETVTRRNLAVAATTM